MSDTSKKIIGEIRDKNIKPISRRYFVIKNAAVWLSLLLWLILGAISISIEEVLIENSNNPYAPPGMGVSHGLVNWVSFLWLFFALLFMALAYLNVRSTKDGYRYRAVWIIIGILLTFITLGVLFHHEGIGDRVESMFESHCSVSVPAPSCPIEQPSSL
jgi:cytochrome bd-type quinol oxidase subunit 2